MGSDSGRRADFSTETRELVARRAGFRCSFPWCGQLTVGPANKPCISVNVGHAAHIYSAATSGKGPRGTGGLTESDLKSPENAIWLCAQHANLIDKNQGEDYPADVLHSYKTLNETRMAHELAESEDGTGRRYLPLLSSSERTRLLMQLGMMAANKLSVLGPTLLILDAGFCLLDTDWLRHCAEILASPTCDFKLSLSR